MQKEQEQLSKDGCPRCGSSNITFEREKHEEIRAKRGTAVVRSTVGFCKDCGYTWKVEGSETGRKRNTLLWVLGWLFCFPIPVMILIWRKQNKWDIKVKIAVTAVFWVFMFFIYGGGNKNSSSSAASQSSDKAGTETAVTETAPAVTTVTDTAATETAVNDTAATAENAPAEEPAAEEPAEADQPEVTDTEAESESETGIRPEIKEAIDDYEAFMIQYCEFMENYDASDFSMLTEYAELMTKYSEAMESMDALEKDFNGAELAYYTEVSLRISQRLLEVSSKM